ncbi:unnamed protein product [Cuscuta epithymum]|uniref:WW domain-containing protein n=1 Tax=Cuscuta epithymum TaxID=186058 RepID=A0AAV0CM13_9ASTE|nr:unnamed protein product [Cuscuta epithymum]
MGTITASLERSLQNCSLNCHRDRSTSHGGGAAALAAGRSSLSHAPPANSSSLAGDATLDLNSESSMPYHWEQCLDLETGEVYYINWRTGMKVKDDPRITNEYSEEEEEEDDEDYYEDNNVTDEETAESSTEESTLSSSKDILRLCHVEGTRRPETASTAAVLVVAGCKTCLMYFMVPKEVKDCPKCCGQLLHFDRSDNSSSA